MKNGEGLRLKQPALTKWWALKCLCWARHLRLPLPTCHPAQPSCQIRLGNHQSATEIVFTGKGSLKLWMEIMNAGMVSFAFFSMAWVMQWQSPTKQAQRLDALLLSTGLLWDHLPRLKTKVVRSKGKGKHCKLLQYSSMDKSWGQGHLPHSPWSWMEPCRLPWSPHHCPSGCLGMQVQHQT